MAFLSLLSHGAHICTMWKCAFLPQLSTEDDLRTASGFLLCFGLATQLQSLQHEMLAANSFILYNFLAFLYEPSIRFNEIRA